MKRQIITIDENKCTGCGLCVSNCPEGALRIIEGKARLVGDLLCDGLGACIGHCPEGAIKIEEREAEKYDERKVMSNIVRQGTGVLAAHLRHLKDHGQMEYLREALEYLKEHKITIPFADPSPAHGQRGCPGMQVQDLRRENEDKRTAATATPVPSQLRQWPIQLHLLSPSAPYFQNADLVVAADCVPFLSRTFMSDF